MNTTNKQKKESVQGPIFEPFPEPRTMPDGWDLSGLVSEPSPVAGSALDDVSID